MVRSLDLLHSNPGAGGTGQAPGTLLVCHHHPSMTNITFEGKQVPFTGQVVGHAGIMTSEDGSLLIKPSLTAEVSFYETIGTVSDFAPLRPFISKFYGTLRLQGEVDSSVENGEIRITSTDGLVEDVRSLCCLIDIRAEFDLNIC